MTRGCPTYSTRIYLFRFRWDYLDWFQKRTNRYFPGFTEFRRSGVSTQYLKSVFPSESFATWQV